MAGAIGSDGGAIEPCIINSLGKVEGKVLVEVGFGAFEQGEDVGWHLGVYLGLGVHVHDGEVSARTEEATGFLENGDRRTLRQLVKN